jgi:hypothetical protein
MKSHALADNEPDHRGLYWIATFGLIGFGFLGMLSIGRPFLMVGLAMLLLSPFRTRPTVFWPPIAAIIAWNVGFFAIAPMSCTATQTVGAGSSAAGESTTVCSSLTGIIYSGRGIYNPSLEPANQAALLCASLTFFVVLAAFLWLRRSQ